MTEEKSRIAKELYDAEKEDIFIIWEPCNLKDFELTDQQIESLSGLIDQAYAANKLGKPGIIILQPVVYPGGHEVAGCFIPHRVAKKLIKAIRNA